MSDMKKQEFMPEEGNGLRGKSRRKEKNGSKAPLIWGGTLLCLVLIGVGSYVRMGQKYRQVFFPNTRINGLEAGELTIDQVKASLDAGAREYVLTLETRDGIEQISGDAIGLHTEYDGTLEQILADQNPLSWGKYVKSGPEYFIETMMVYEEALLQKAVAGLSCLAPGKELPENAYLSDYLPGRGYEIVPERPGNTAEAQKVEEAVSEAVRNRREQISLEEQDAYRKPEVTAYDPRLVANAQEWNRYVQTEVIYRFGSRSEVLNGDRIHTWLSEDGQGGPVLQREAVTEYVAELAKTYNTAYKPKTLKTSYGPSVTISQGFYGWRINQKEETEALIQILKSGESTEREPVYSQTAASRDGNDYGDTYVEINLTAQHLYFYKDGTLLTESDFVSGNTSRNWGTPPGAFPLTYKERNATLRGENYATPVKYWMPFNGNIGMHDAGWRSDFGGTIYKRNGSHGCINLPPSVAKTIFENISAGMPVLCYYLEGTEQTDTAKKPPETTAAEPETTPVASETTPAEPETTPAEQETTPAVPETTPAEPETTPAAPETTTAAPETGSPSPGGEGGPGEKREEEHETEKGPGGPGVAGKESSAPEIGPGV